MTESEPTNEDLTPSEKFLEIARSLGLSEGEIHEGLADMHARRERDAAAAGPSSRTTEHPLIKRLARQARQYDHAANTATTETARNLLRQQHTLITMLCTLGLHPEKWDEMASTLIPLNVEMLASVISAGYAQLPPAEHDHD